MPHTVLITGATGLLGRPVLRAFSESPEWEAVGTGFSRAKPSNKIIKLDLGDQAAVEKTIDDVKPDLIVHCAANRFPDACASDPSGTRALNITATSHLATLASHRKISLIYLSTDYVFPGLEGEAPYEADSPPRPTTFYGETKFEGEKAVRDAYAQSQGGDHGGKGVILRVPVLYGDVANEIGNQESAINTLLETVWKAAQLPSHEPPMKVDDWSQRYPTNTEDVARVIFDIAQRYTSPVPTAQQRQAQGQAQGDEEKHLPEILHFSAEEPFTKYSICKLLAEILDIDIETKLVGDQPEDHQKGGERGNIQRPYDTHLSTKSLRELGVNVHAQDFRAWWRWRVRAFRK